MVDDLMVDVPLRVLDVGSGTGIASRLFVRRGCQVLGIEPDERMAAIAQRAGLHVECTDLETWDAAGRSFDLLVSGQAWHWVDPDLGADKAATVLRPGGRVGLFWNRGGPAAPMGDLVDDIYRDLAPGLGTSSIVLGHMGNDRFETAASALEATKCFEPIVWRTYRWDQVYTRDEWIDLLSTHSDHRTLPRAQLEAILAAVGQVIDEHGGSLGVDYTTVLITTRRR